MWLGNRVTLGIEGTCQPVSIIATNTGVSKYVRFSTTQPTARRVARFSGRETPRLPSLYSKRWKAVRNEVSNTGLAYWGGSQPLRSMPVASSGSRSPTGRRQADVWPVCGGDGPGLHGILLPVAPVGARDGWQPSDPAARLPRRRCRRGRWLLSDAARRSSTATRLRNSAEHSAPACRASPPSCRHARFRKTGNLCDRLPRAAEAAQ